VNTDQRPQIGYRCCLSRQVYQRHANGFIGLGGVYHFVQFNQLQILNIYLKVTEKIGMKDVLIAHLFDLM
jgi:hypothetical protein